MAEAIEPVRPFFLGVDLGGTNIKAGVVDDSGRPLSSVNVPTEAEKGPEHGVARICHAARQAVLQAGLTLDDVSAIGVGSPGPMDLKAQIIIDPHNLPGWLNLPLARLVGEQLGLPAVLQNDANAAAYGEYWIGAGKGANSMVQFTLGTGIGCGIVIAGNILEGEHSHGGEAGHQRIAIENPRLNSTGLYGSLEAYASATAVVDRTLEAISTGAETILKKTLDWGERLTARAVFQAAEAGDKLAERIVDETAFYLAIGATNLIHIIDPDLVVYSGGMIAAGAAFLEKIQNYTRENLLPVPRQHMRLVYASLGTDAGFIGAAGCARRKFATSP
jgi:glucokinase